MSRSSLRVRGTSRCSCWRTRPERWVGMAGLGKGIDERESGASVRIRVRVSGRGRIRVRVSGRGRVRGREGVG